jgi:hypothetical protein
MSTSNLPPLPDLSPDWTPYWRGVVERILREYAEKAVAAERERCAKLALRRSRVATTPSGAVALVNFANELRGGSQP